MAKRYKKILQKRPELLVQSATGSEGFRECPRKHYLSHLYKFTSGEFAKGISAHRRMEQFWVWKNGILQPRYKSAKAWANAERGSWSQTVKKGSIGGKIIRWAYEDEPWIIRSQLERICLLNYDRLVEEGPPVFSEYKFERIRIANRYFTGRMDEIRRGRNTEEGIRIRDYKTGYVKRDKKDKERVLVDGEKDRGFQFTIYVLAYIIEARLREDFRRILGISDRKVKEWQENDTLISPEIELEYYMLEASDDPIVKVRERTYADYVELCDTYDNISKYRRYLKEQKEWPAYRSIFRCRRCIFFKECNEMTERLAEQERLEQLYIGFDIIKEPPEARALHGPIATIHKLIRPKKRESSYAQLTFRFPKKQEKKKKKGKKK